MFRGGCVIITTADYKQTLPWNSQANPRRGTSSPGVFMPTALWCVCQSTGTKSSRSHARKQTRRFEPTLPLGIHLLPLRKEGQRTAQLLYQNSTAFARKYRFKLRQNRTGNLLHDSCLFRLVMLQSYYPSRISPHPVDGQTKFNQHVRRFLTDTPREAAALWGALSIPKGRRRCHGPKNCSNHRPHGLGEDLAGGGA